MMVYAVLYLGSSPHTRGARRRQSEIHLGGRIIPAYAGSTRACRRRSSTGTDHPRIRGEHRGAVGNVDSAEGSSPHTRGALVAPEVDELTPRIIPAYAGSTWTRSRSGSASGDHPRIRGEHTDKTEALGLSQGSSPHTRGAHPRPLPVRHADRIIPAYAGSTPPFRFSLNVEGDHPRIRGEHLTITASLYGYAGSSPHTRGALAPGYQAIVWCRIIPAYAGSTYAMQGLAVCLPDHPRIRGEHEHLPAVGQGVFGSSPHTRGARHQNRRRPKRTGIIPAYAGSTFMPSWRRGDFGDHPRIRGEHQSLV